MSFSLGDPQTFDRVYREHRSAAWAAAYGVLRDAAAAEDVVQECFTQLWRRPGAFDARRGSVRVYITMLARSRALDRSRAQAARDSAAERFKASLGSVPLHAGSAADRAIDRERSARVVSMLDRLPRTQREALVLAFGGGLSATEIADAVGVPPGTAKSRVRLGLAKLRGAAAGEDVS
jgi:RNA polymerase sigma-70 factor, ECF subfamily